MCVASGQEVYSSVCTAGHKSSCAFIRCNIFIGDACVCVLGLVEKFVCDRQYDYL